MLDYLTKVVAATNPSVTNAIPYLGTFSRALNAPSWFPEQDATSMPGYYNGLFTYSEYGGNISETPSTSSGYFYVNPYRDNAETNTDSQGNRVANRDIPNVRWPNDATVTHYRDDGTSYTYSVKAGDPSVKYRFSLAKLAWLTPTGPAPGISATAISNCFGLVWDPQNFSSTPYHYDRWDYVATNNTTPLAIKTLDQVAADGREPNFFEMLRAGILSGSLGHCPGPNTGNYSSWDQKAPADSYGVAATNLETFYTDKSRHILQIGANIIDQSDSDSIPTALYLQLWNFGTGSTSTEQDLAFNTVYGQENLPYITRLNEIDLEDWYDGISSNGYWKEWIHPEIWNPYQVPPPGVTLANHPTQFRIHAYGSVSFQCAQNSGNWRPTLAGGRTWASSGAGAYAPLMNYDSPSSYTYHRPADGSSMTIATCAAPDSLPVTGTTAANAPANLVYFTDVGSAASIYYSCPLWLTYDYPGFGSYTNSVSYGAYYSNCPISNFQGTHMLNMFYPPNDYVENNGVDLYPTNNLWQGWEFVGLFTGEYTCPDVNEQTNGQGVGVNLTSTMGGNPLYISLECQDTSNHWHPYSFISRLVGLSDCGLNPGSITTNFMGTPGSATGHAANGVINIENTEGRHFKRVDPRTDRFSIQGGRRNWSYPKMPPLSSDNPQNGAYYHNEGCHPLAEYGFSENGGADYQWQENQSANNTFYADPDLVVRPGDGYRQNITTGDGCSLYNGISSGSSGNKTTPASGLPTNTVMTPTGSAQVRRPVILNRPFRSVAELGYAYRDLPFKTLDFFSTSSADAGLLDLFSVVDEPPIVAGEINVNHAPLPILSAIFNGSQKMEINSPSVSSNFMTLAESTNLATTLSLSLEQTNSIINRADIVTQNSDIIFNKLYASNLNYANKPLGEAPVRSLADVVNTRTWNLFIDVVAQSGHMSPLAKSMNDFVVEGERRYWLHIAIDRYTGKIIAEQLEPVYE